MNTWKVRRGEDVVAVYEAARVEVTGAGALAIYTDDPRPGYLPYVTRIMGPNTWTDVEMTTRG